VIDELLALIAGDLRVAGIPRAPAPTTQAERAALLAAARAPLPPGVRGVHPSWIEAALAELPERARVAFAAGGGDPVDVWLVRWACAELPPLPAVREVAAPRAIEDVIAMARLDAWLAGVGRAQLVYAASLAQPGAPRRDELGPARAVIGRCRGGDPHLVGARAIAPYGCALAARQIAVRLTRPLGLAVEAELLAHARDPIEHAPRWAALV
jgi:hypothetical protein